MFSTNHILKSTLFLAIGVLFISCGTQEFSKNRLLEYDGKFPEGVVVGPRYIRGETF